MNVMPSSAPPTLSTFHLFPSLPSELRLKIWRHACFPRILTLTYNTSEKSFHSPSPPPTVLSVSHEARHEALRIYTLSFSTPSPNSRPRIYFNPHLDTLYLPRHGSMGYDETLRDLLFLVSPSDVPLLSKLREIAIDHVDPNEKRPWESYNKASLVRGFRQLDEIKLVLDSEESDWDREVTRFGEPSGDPERMLRMWYCFRQAFSWEEKVLEDVCIESGREYQQYVLPTLRIKQKFIKGRDVNNRGIKDVEIKDVETALERVRF